MELITKGNSREVSTTVKSGARAEFSCGKFLSCEKVVIKF